MTPDPPVPGPAGSGEPAVDSFAAEEPPPTAPGGEPAEAARTGGGPQGSQGLTTAPAPLRGPGAAGPAPQPDQAPVAEPEPLEQAVAAEPRSAPDLATPASPPAAARRSRRWVPVTAVGLAVALLAGTTGWLAWQLRQQDRADRAAVEAVAAARDAARLLFSYDHKTLKADFDKGLAVTTGEFRSQYSRTTTEVVTPVATQYKAVVRAEVVEAAVIDARPDEVSVLVFLNQATSSTRVKGQQVDQSRVRMRLVQRGGRWLVEEVKAL